MSNRGLLSEKKAGSKQTVHPSKLHISPLTARVRLNVSSPSPFAGPWHPFTLGSTSSAPSLCPLSPSPSVRSGWAGGLKLQHSLRSPQAEKKQLLPYSGPALPRSSRWSLFSKVRSSKAAKFIDIETPNRSVTLPAQGCIVRD